VSAILPVGMRKASIMNARKTNARIKAVINHSKVFAASMALAFRPVFFGFIFSLSSRLIMVNAAEET
jgi:hypothetical protein